MNDLLLVDDESAVVDALALTIDWTSLGFSEVHTALSAEEALAISRKNPIALVVSDIRMPGMNGLELIEKIKEMNSHAKCIILSGFSDFEYTQEAIRLKSDGYLLKPVSDEKIIGEVSRLLKEYREEWERVSSYRRALSTLKNHLPLLQSQLLLQLLADKSPFPSLEQRLETLEIEVSPGEPFSLLLIRLEDESLEEGNPDITEYGIMNLIRDLKLTGQDSDLWMGKDGMGNLIYFLPGDPEGNVSKKISLLQGLIGDHFQRKASVIISRRGVFPGDLPLRYGDMLSAMRKMIGGDEGLCLYLEQDLPELTVQASSVLYEFPSLRQILEIPSWEKAEGRVKDICSYLKESWPQSHEHLVEAFFVISSALMQTAHRNGQILFDLMEERGLSWVSVEALRSIDHLESFSLGIIELLKTEFMQDMHDSRSRLVTRINEYIADNLGHDLSLQVLSDHMSLHPVYISKIYKQETGDNISAHILRKRMEVASHMLRSTNRKVNAIGRGLGFSHPAYFNKVFKDYFGLTPQEFRTQN